MRVAVDLQALQSEGSRNRGIGRYVQSLLEHLFPLAQSVSYELYANKNLPAPELGGDFGPIRFFSCETPSHSGVSDALYKTVLLRDKPDALFLPSPLEMTDPVMPSFTQFPMPVYAVCYDLVPLLFPDKYLRDRTTRALYTRRMQNLRYADALFAISESARQDSIRLLDVSPEKIINVTAGVSPFFAPTPESERAAWQAVFARRFQLTRPYVLCTGGEDWRKNLEGLVDGFARLPSRLQKEHQLVIACRMSDGGKRALMQRAQQRGLPPGTLAVTGFVSDEELRALYGLCKLFAFPSFYEGFGLPLVEALACGAPVITANNSSLVEIVPSLEQQFEARSPDSLARRLEVLLSDPSALSRLSGDNATRMAAPFTWQAVAEKISAVFERNAAIWAARKNGSEIPASETSGDIIVPPVRETFVFQRAATENEPIALACENRLENASDMAELTVKSGAVKTKRIALWSPQLFLQKTQSGENGVGGDMALCANALEGRFALDVFTEAEGVDGLSDTISVVHAAQFVDAVEEKRRDYAGVLYQIGSDKGDPNTPYRNDYNPSYKLAYAALMRYAGITILRDDHLTGLLHQMTNHNPELGVSLLDEMTHQYGAEQARVWTTDLAREKITLSDLATQNVRTNRRVFTRSLGVVLTSARAYARAVREHGDFCPHIAHIPLVVPVPNPSEAAQNDSASLKAEWGIPQSAFVWCVAGLDSASPAQTSAVWDVLQAHHAHYPDSFFLLTAASDATATADARAKKRGMENYVKITGRINAPGEVSRVADACVFASDETEAEAERLFAMAHSKACIVFGAPGEFANESPGSVLLAADANELTQTMAKLKNDAAYRKEWENAARETIERDHSAARCADRITAFLEQVIGDAQTRPRLLADYAGREVARAALVEGLDVSSGNLLTPFAAALTASFRAE